MVLFLFHKQMKLIHIVNFLNNSRMPYNILIQNVLTHFVNKYQEINRNSLDSTL